MEAKPEGSPRRVGHGIASPKGAAKKEVHTSITGSLDEPSCTANREVQPHPSPRLRYSEWLPTQGQLSCLWCQRLRAPAVNCECLASQFPSPSAGRAKTHQLQSTKQQRSAFTNQQAHSTRKQPSKPKQDIDLNKPLRPK